MSGGIPPNPAMAAAAHFSTHFMMRELPIKTEGLAIPPVSAPMSTLASQQPRSQQYLPTVRNDNASASSTAADEAALEMELKRPLESEQSGENGGGGDQGNGGPIRCDHCDYTTDKRDRLMRHIRTVHLNMRPFACDVCPSTFGRKDKLKRHVETVHSEDKPYKCDFCAHSSSRRDKMRDHVATVHLKTKPPRPHRSHKKKKAASGNVPIQENSQEQVARPQYQLQSHVLEAFHPHLQPPHTGQVATDRSGGSSLAHQLMVKHIRFPLPPPQSSEPKQQQARPFACSLCPSTFARKDKLKRHVAEVHCSSKPFKCDYCSHTASRRDKMKSHVESVHMKRPLSVVSTPQLPSMLPVQDVGTPSDEANKFASQYRLCLNQRDSMRNMCVLPE